MRALLVLLAILACAVPTAGADPSVAAAAALHPVVRAFGLAEPPPAGPLWLVRSAALPAAPAGVTLLARRGSAALATADEAGVAALRRSGALVVALDGPLRAAAAPPPLAAPREADPLIQSLVDAVAWPPLAAKIAALEAFATRYSFSPEIEAAADSLAARFAALGLAVEFHDFAVQGHPMRNVVATQLGAAAPDSIVVVCAHYDCTSEDPYELAPGADDNASGTAVVLTAAELLAPLSCRYTVKYLCFAGEEQGLRGSQAWVADAAAQGLAIVAALNFDMAGWWTPGVDFDVEIEADEASVWLADIVVAAASTYTDMPFELHVYDGAWWGDHASFWQHGYAALNHEEAWDWGDADFNPRYHSTGDRLEHLDPDFVVGNARLAVAALATLARPGLGVAVADVPAPVVTLRVAPNPFNGRLQVAAVGAGDRATVDVFDLLGRRVDSLVVPLVGGRGEASWDARDAAGRPLPAGSYLLRAAGSPAGPVARALLCE